VVTALHNKLEYGDVYQWDDGDPIWDKMRKIAHQPAQSEYEREGE
jgi:hypothetical protein